MVIHNAKYAIIVCFIIIIIISAANRIETITDNVRIGFGSFNDKITRPYTYHLDPLPNGDCPVNNPEICRHYAFRHQITLTDNITFYNVSEPIAIMLF